MFSNQSLGVNNMHSETKHYNMKQFLNAAKEYSHTRAEETANVLNRYLQLLGVAIDTNIFDPHTSIVCEFFVSLHELLTNIETKSTLAWCCVNVLSVACRNAAARHALIHTYQFLPALSRLLGDHLTTDKKIRLLRLLQELTCGIKISWQIPHLPHLMQILTKWVESQEQEIVSLSLAVLVNLCYKNVPAIYTLSRVVDTKQFLRTCTNLEGANIEVHVCKLLIILEHINGTIQEQAVLKLITVTFKSALEAFRAKDSILLRHVVEFFMDVKNQNNRSTSFIEFPSYKIEIEKLLGVLETIRVDSGDEGYDEECISVMFEFLKALVELKIPTLSMFHSRIITVTMGWVSTEAVCSPALSILKTIALQKHNNPDSILQPLINGLPIFLLAIDLKNDEEIPLHAEQCKLLSELMQLLRVLAQAESVRVKVLHKLKEETLLKIFMPLLNNDKSPRERATSADSYSPDALRLYVHALGLIYELGKHDADWINMFCNLMEQKQLHMILAQALFSGSEDVKLITLDITAYKSFPREEMASAMNRLQSLVNTEVSHLSETNLQHMDYSYPIITVAQNERLDAVMSKVKTACEDNSFANISMSDVMELYEYKLAAMGHAERASLASMEAASQRCVHLQHRVAQLTAELTRLHQLLFHLQQNNEEISKEHGAVQLSLKDITNKLGAETGKRKIVANQLQEKDKQLEEQANQFEHLTKQHVEMTEERDNLSLKNNELITAVQKLERTLKKQEEYRENYKKQIQKIEKQLEKTEAELREKTAQLAEMSQELHSRNQIIETITKLTTSSRMAS